MNKCEKCYHWGELVDNEEEGECGNMHVHLDIVVYVTNSSEESLEIPSKSFITNSDFGCVHFEKKS